MDVFQLRDDLIDDYSAYVSSFLAIRDTRIASHVETNIAEGHLWPDPRIGLNPAFESGGWIDELASDGLIHPSCKSIFRVGKPPEDPKMWVVPSSAPLSDIQRNVVSMTVRRIISYSKLATRRAT